jgi:glucose-6-phosphate dehydrogenase assembly protein OpcA
MSDSTNIVQVLCSRAATSLRSEWTDIVAVSVRILPEKQTVDEVAGALAKATRVGIESIKRKIVAVQKMHSLGFSEAEIVAMGQEQVIGQFQKEKRQDNYQNEVWMKFKVKGSQREIVMQQIERVMTVCGFKTKEEFFDWMYAQLANTTEEELKHSAGMNK